MEKANFLVLLYLAMFVINAVIFSGNSLRQVAIKLYSPTLIVIILGYYLGIHAPRYWISIALGFIGASMAFYDHYQLTRILIPAKIG